jgi:hypothetical protein
MTRDSLYKEEFSLSIVKGENFGYLGALLLGYIVEHFASLMENLMYIFI